MPRKRNNDGNVRVLSSRKISSIPRGSVVSCRTSRSMLRLLDEPGRNYNNWLDARRCIEDRADWPPCCGGSSSPLCLCAFPSLSFTESVLTYDHCLEVTADVPSHAEVARHAERCMLQGVITSLQLPPSTFFAALRPTNQIFHVSWHAPSTHK